MLLSEAIVEVGTVLSFNPEAFDFDTKYIVEADGYSKLFSSNSWDDVARCNSPDSDPKRVKSWQFSGNLISLRNTIIEPRENKFNKPNRRTAPNHTYPWRWNSSELVELIQVPCELVHDGSIKLYHEDGSPVENPTIIKEMYGIDYNMIKPGQIWKLTIDGDPRFQNTMVMIMKDNERYDNYRTLNFIYQTETLYEDGYSERQTANGVIEVYNHSEGKEELNDLSKVHMELVIDNSNPDGTRIDCSDPDMVFPRRYGVGLREIWPDIRPYPKRSDKSRDPYNDTTDKMYPYIEE